MMDACMLEINGVPFHLLLMFLITCLSPGLRELLMGFWEDVYLIWELTCTFVSVHLVQKTCSFMPTTLRWNVVVKYASFACFTGHLCAAVLRWCLAAQSVKVELSLMSTRSFDLNRIITFAPLAAKCFLFIRAFLPKTAACWVWE